MAEQTPPAASTNNRYTWDVVAAEADYVNDATQSYSTIAKKYKTTKQAVGRYAKQRDWTRRRREGAENALNNAESEKVKQIADANKRHLSLFKNMQNLGNKALVRLDKEAGDNKVPDVKSAQAAGTLLKMGIDGERVILDLPTSVAAHTGKGGENIWQGFSDMLVEARKVKDGPSDGQPSAGNP